MKFSSTLALFAVPAALALPTVNSFRLMVRQSVEAVTDNLLFSVSLPTFTSRRNADDPSYLDWTSDGCTSSPDNPLGFPYVPACNRHDFGYQNYRAQTRFTVSAKLAIDNNFKTDLYYQCESVSLGSICRALADVYYAAVRAFGGGDATPDRRDEDWVAKYYEAVEIYNKLVEEAGLEAKISG